MGKSATDMIRERQVYDVETEKKAKLGAQVAELNAEVDYLEQLSQTLIRTISYLRGLEVEGVPCESRRMTIDFLATADTEMHNQLIELKRTIKKLEKA